MARRRRRQPEGSIAHIWPGFTDALAGLVVVLVFLLILFFLFEVVLSRQVGSQEETITALRGQVERLSDLLGTAEEREKELQEELAASRKKRAQLEERLAEQRQRAERLGEELAAAEEARRQVREQLAQVGRDQEATEAELAEERKRARTASANLDALAEHVARLNERLRRLERALKVEERERVAAESRVEELQGELEAQQSRQKAQAARIEAMAARIRTELLKRVEELERYRSEFFGRLRQVFADRRDIKIRGDRFVFQSEILFPSGKAELSPGGKRQLDRFVATYGEVRDRIPEGLEMIIMVEGHTDRVPITTAEFSSNWELSSARALSVLHHLREQGVKPQRLAATAYGEYHPLTPGQTPEQRRQNRRIELKITRY
ncbi:OmpA family protein [Thiohalorhabdus sp.]|uniref:OmpA family protein n=1 Tax=Thiohalorhabdus sp. TaxID=3094134 RepID=UPI002FC2EBDB